MSANISEALFAVVDRLVIATEHDDELRKRVRNLAQVVLDATANDLVAEVDGEIVLVVEEEEADEEMVAEDVVECPSAAELARHLWPTRFGVIPEAPALKPTQSATTYDTSPNVHELSLIEKRCRLKAEGLRWSVERQRRIGEGAAFRTEIEPVDSDLISRAKELPDCFLWMNHPSGPSPLNHDAWEDVAGCFENLADVLAVIREASEDVETHADVFEHGLDLMAEAQSALRVAVAAIDGPPDSDQKAAFIWLRETANVRQIFIQRFMRSSEAADPTAWEDLTSRNEQLDADFQQDKQVQTLRRKRMKKVAYVVKQIVSGEEGGNSNEWDTLLSTIEELGGDGLPPSNRELREHLLPVIEELPEDVGTVGYTPLVLREIDRYLASQPPDHAPVPSTIRPTKSVQNVAAALKGRTVVMIGGERRPHAQAALKAAFGLEDLIWISTKEHESPAVFEPYIAKPEVALVLLAIRWSSHSYGDVKHSCDTYGKYFVRLKAGYNPNQVAAHIVDQCPSLLAGK